MSTIAFPGLASFAQRGLDSDILCLIDPATPISRLVYYKFLRKNFVAVDKFHLAQPIKTLAEVAYKKSHLSPEEETAFRAWAQRHGIKINGAVPAGADDVTGA
ncbi:hypothetical protein JCM10908_002595 [Rhodotorula pacifica]|uniref:uncharacterized protein n=1 Tax=Rhodotorula pacifica TaxID=1495444 RepID=UPI00317F86F1